MCMCMCIAAECGSTCVASVSVPHRSVFGLVSVVAWGVVWIKLLASERYYAKK
jgi:hypothetical protein